MTAFFITKTNPKLLFLSLLKYSEISIMTLIETRPQALYIRWLGYGCPI